MKRYPHAALMLIVGLISAGWTALGTGQEGSTSLASLARKKTVVLEGKWTGTLEPPGAQLRLSLEVSRAADGSYTGSLVSLDQGNAAIPIKAVRLSGNQVTLDLPLIGGGFDGRLSADGREIAGTWRQGPGELPLTFRRTEPASAGPRIKTPARADAERFVGTWAGTLEPPGAKLRLALKVTPTTDGPLQAVMISLDQGNAAIPVSTVAVEGNTVKLDLPMIQGAYEGQLDPAGNEITGTWRQGPSALPLVLKRSSAESILPKRPQEPGKPYPYREEDVSCVNQAANVTLAGTLTLPPSGPPFPAVLLLTGSGSQDRDESILGHKPFRVLADYLTRRGMAVLRMDDRGTGKSSRGDGNPTTRDFAGDARAGVDYLRTRPDIDPARIGLLGHSEGGLIAVMVAAGAKDIAFVVLMAGTGLPGEQVLYRQGEMLARAGGQPETEIVKTRQIQEAMFTVVKTVDDPATARKRLEEIAAQYVRGLTEQQRKELGNPESYMQGQIQMLLSPWIKFFLTYDPRPELSRVTCPVLALCGEKDLQVAPDENLAAIAAALKTGGNPDVTCIKMPGLNHLFQKCASGTVAEYSTIEETLNPSFLETVGNWIRKRVGAAAP